MRGRADIQMAVAQPDQRMAVGRERSQAPMGT
jgi:hypothetical protein